MLRNKLKRWIYFPEYFIENFGKKLSGRGLDQPQKNGEFKLIEEIVKNHRSVKELCVLDVGANLGIHTKKFLEFGVQISNLKILAIEPSPNTLKKLRESFDDERVSFGDYAVADEDGEREFFLDPTHQFSGSNSLYAHYYLKGETRTVKVKKIDSILSENHINHLTFLKIDTEGAELDALVGAQKSMEAHKIDYIQIEYNQTWIKSGASIELLLGLCSSFKYKLYRITSRGLISIAVYNYLLEDFYYQNLLLVSESAKNPMKIVKTALPPEITDTQ